MIKKNYLRERGKKRFVSLKLEYQCGVRTHDLRLSKQAANIITAPGPLPQPQGTPHGLQYDKKSWFSLL